MGWEEIPWYTLTDDFDADFDVGEWHGTNAFIRDDDGIFRTYFVDKRGDEAMGGTWSYLDITALGRQEIWEDSPEGYPQTQAYGWWNRHDEYDDATDVRARPLRGDRLAARRAEHVIVIAHVGRSPGRGAAAPDGDDRGGRPARRPGLDTASRVRRRREPGQMTATTTLRMKRTYEAPAQRVFDAWTSEEVMRRWFHGQHDWETTEAEVDLRVGGSRAGRHARPARGRRVRRRRPVHRRSTRRTASRSPGSGTASRTRR